MKTKLLKKIRKRFEILYYPNRKSDNYRIVDNSENEYSNNYFWSFGVSRTHESKQSAIAAVLSIVKGQYKHLSRKHKQSKIHTKVWYK